MLRPKENVYIGWENIPLYFDTFSNVLNFLSIASSFSWFRYYIARYGSSNFRYVSLWQWFASMYLKYSRYSDVGSAPSPLALFRCMKHMSAHVVSVVKICLSDGNNGAIVVRIGVCFYCAKRICLEFALFQHDEAGGKTLISININC
jgi:hypothetical protein